MLLNTRKGFLSPPLTKGGFREPLNTTKGGLNPPFVVLSCRDSNPERQNQNLLCYHYTTAQSVARKRCKGTNKIQNAKCKMQKFCKKSK